MTMPARGDEPEAIASESMTPELRVRVPLLQGMPARIRHLGIRARGRTLVRRHRAVLPATMKPPLRDPVLEQALVPKAAPAAAGARRLLRPALLLIGLLAIGLAIRHLPGGHDGMLPAIDVLRHGLRGRLLFLLAGTLICAVGMPRQAICFTGGIAYGLVPGIVLSSLATLAGCLLGFLWARLAGRDWARRRLLGRAQGWLARLDRLVAARPFGTILMIRLLPVGSSLALNLAAGVLGLRLLPFLAATLLGSLPQTVIFTLLGSGTRIGHETQILLAILLFVASGAAGLLLIRRSGGIA